MIRDVHSLIRVRQWTKNLLCFGGLFISRTVHWDAASLLGAALAFAAFCLAASSVYVFNDLHDAPRDRIHPRKRSRPIASGRVGPAAAWLLIALLAGGSLAVGVAGGPHLLACIGLYLLINIVYTLRLKTVPIIDVFCISAGFLLRLLAGIYAVGDQPTSWVVLCTLFITLFVGFAKRRSELATHAESDSQRPVLARYSLDYLDMLINASATMAVVMYALFTTSSGRDPSLAVTVLPVVFAVFRYQHILMIGAGAEEPDRVLLSDAGIRWAMVVWLLSFYAISRLSPGLFL